MRFRNPSEIKKKKRGRGASRGELDTLSQPHHRTKKKKKVFFLFFVLFLLFTTRFSSSSSFLSPTSGKKRTRFFKKNSSERHVDLKLSPSNSLRSLLSTCG